MNKLSDFVWEIPPEETGASVPVRIYANEKIAQSMQGDRTLKQAANAAKLPKIVKNLLVMPDGHEGYGFPVGGVAAFDAEDGIISPGVVGYDINCLTPDTRVQCDFGTWSKISEIKDNLDTISFDSQRNISVKTKPLLVLQRPENEMILKIHTKLGKEITVTENHPILTNLGMVLAGNLKEGTSLVVHGFSGIEYQQPSNKLIIDNKIIEKVLDQMGINTMGHGKRQIISYLEKRSLCKLSLSSKQTPILLKLLGLILGDGSVQRNGFTSIYGKLEDLEEAKKDIESLGFRCRIYNRLRACAITTKYGHNEFTNMEYSIHISSRAFGVLVAALGIPIGNKSLQKHHIPEWIQKAELWQKRLFLASYFGAEMAKPMSPNGYNFTMPSFSISKLESLSDNIIELLLEIRGMLSSLSIESSDPKIVEGYTYEGKHGKTIGFRLSILSNTPNIIRFFSTVGYLYNKQKERLSSLATLYLNHLELVRSEREKVRYNAISLYSRGTAVKRILELTTNQYADASFVKHAIWTNRKGGRVWKLEKFDEFCKNSELGDGYAYDTVIQIEKIPYKGDVYDLSINDTNHNFIANDIVVSNCGVRLIKTNLTIKELKPKLSQLMDSLFKHVPSGVGSRINLGFTKTDLDRVTEEGVEYIIKKGFGFESDLERIEEHGVLEGADISKVSDFSRKRGVNELGTLGAGNHFLEVQRVDKILSPAIAEGFGLEKDQVTIMIHSGSRGFGHQVCSDYLKIFSEYQKKENIVPPDPELCYAFIGTKPANDYLSAMKAAVNFAFTNRQIMTDSIRKGFKEVFGKDPDALGMELLYDVAHNIAKLEEHEVDGRMKKVYIHRKGATRAFGPHHKQIPDIYKEFGQPVIIPGSMGSASYVLAGRAEAMKETFGSSCHGSGRVMSRHQAIRDIPASRTLGDLSSKGIELRVRNKKLISEEAEWAYKNVDDVVQSIEGAKISNIVARLVPLGVAKG
jgi:tRNA-splicing ligase RtcB